MTYASQQDLIARYGDAAVIELADRTDPPSGAIDTTIVAGALARTAAFIDSFVGRHHTLPLQVIPPALIGCQCNLAWEDLHGDRPTEAVTAAADRARAWLRALAAGDAVLDGLTDTQQVVGNPVAIAAPARVLTDETMVGF